MKVTDIVKLVTIITALMAIAACSSPVVRQPAPLAEFGAAAPPVPAKEYRIQAGDQLDIKFFYNAELNETVIVRPDGRISLMLATEVMAAGGTPAELTEQLQKKYSTTIDRPEIAVIVRSFNAQRIYVDGEVGRPGAVTLTDPMTVMQAVSQAGGFKDTARRKEVIVMRRSLDGKVSSTVVDLEKSIDGSDLKQDIALVSYDVIYVPRSAIADVNLWVDQYIRRNIPISVGTSF